MYQSLQEMPVGQKVGKNSIHSDFRVFSADFLNKTKIPETFINQGFRELVGLVGLEPITSTMLRSKIVHKNTLTTHNKWFEEREYKVLHICTDGCRKRNYRTTTYVLHNVLYQPDSIMNKPSCKRR